MYKLTILLIMVLAFARPVGAQNTIFLSHGKIEYERRINVFAQIGNDDDQWSEFRKKLSNHFKTSYFDLLFTRDKSLYRPGRESSDRDMFSFWQSPAQDNTIWSDLANDKAVSQKNVFEQTFLVQDSLRKIKWKITDETRNIAGFNCRRANAIIMDTIYVVAFYTDEILTNGGPESFTGLPGMILGVSLPHQHISWFATKVEAIPITEAEVEPPVKGKKVNNTALLQAVKPSLKDWRKIGQQYLEAIML
ncbi:MAG TPA: GLPGLI family protein [Puia sp.]|nr:GLPGLI family protein [Puia sp.]